MVQQLAGRANVTTTLGYLPSGGLMGAGLSPRNLSIASLGLAVGCLIPPLLVGLLKAVNPARILRQRILRRLA